MTMHTETVVVCGEQRVITLLLDTLDDGGGVGPPRRAAVAKGGWWQIAVLELSSMKESLLTSETRSVDDQVEWLDDGQVVYHQPSSHGADIWALRIDNRAPPRLLLTGAYSPAVVRE